ncbi:helix-hairpin-helix domain-containing protein [Streptomyces sp. IBSBF 2435]|uniref:helix-hairpin-helix domain-containing protein n=1 Tax=Streptomyces sp. IBSBF 2435 TaxID=2903531 RepID=UPI002FDC5E8A
MAAEAAALQAAEAEAADTSAPPPGTETADAGGSGAGAAEAAEADGAATAPGAEGAGGAPAGAEGSGGSGSGSGTAGGAPDAGDAAGGSGPGSGAGDAAESATGARSAGGSGPDTDDDGTTAAGTRDAGAGGSGAGAAGGAEPSGDRLGAGRGAGVDGGGPDGPAGAPDGPTGDRVGAGRTAGVNGGGADGRTGDPGGPAGTPGAGDSRPQGPQGGPAGTGRPQGGARRVALDAGAVAAAAAVLGEGGAPAELAEGAVRLLGERAAAELRADPWLVLGVAGVQVEQGDAFARGLLGSACGPGDERRARALVARVLEDAAQRGHTALPPADLHTALRGYSLPDPEAAVTAAVTDGQLLVFREGDDQDEDGEEDVSLLLGLDRYAMAEESLADGFFRLLRSFEGESGGEEPQWARTAAPTPSAAELIRAAAGSGLVVHSGGEAARAEPAALVAAARAAGLRAYAAAYTENGRRRLAAAVGEDAAVTVAGLLSGAEGPGLAGDGSLGLDLLAVLDAPQLSVEEATTLVEAVPDGARLVLSGDPHALWSAGAGRVFADLLAARVCPRVVSRTPDPGPIGELVSCVGEGELASVDAPDKEVVVVPVRDPREAVHRTVQLVADSVPRAFGVEGAQVQVVTTGHGGPVGTRALNAALKERLNPGPGRFGGFDPGDRVVHVPVPGRTLPGTVTGAEPEGLRLDCEGGSVLVPRGDVAATVRHGWAVTGHQAAGMRWPAAVVVVPGDAGPLLTRSWVYTAFGRGERHLSVVQGAEQQLAQAVAGPPATERTTRLAAVLRELTAQG